MDETEYMCPKCNFEFTDKTSEDFREVTVYNHECPFEDCDDKECRALKDPKTLDDYKLATTHWKSHRLLSGCSHAN